MWYSKTEKGLDKEQKKKCKLVSLPMSVTRETPEFFGEML